MSRRQTSRGIASAISSPGSADGVALYDSPDGQMLLLSGPGAVRASRSVAPGNTVAAETSATSSRYSRASSRSAILQRSLANRLQARLGVSGSAEYGLRWSTWAIAWGPPICALRASARRTSGSGCSGWPTPTSALADKGVRSTEGGIREAMRNHGPDLAAVVTLAGWPTPGATDGDKAPRWFGRGPGNPSLGMAATYAGLATPTVLDSTSTRNRTAKRSDPNSPHHDGQTLVDMASGAGRSGCAAQTGSRGVLNPRFSLWLMGYPDEWASCGERAMQSHRR